MLSRTTDAAVIALLIGAAIGLYERSARACGPNFPTHLLAQRDSTLLDLHEGVFLIEATQLVDPPARPYVVRAEAEADNPGTIAARARGGDAERQLYERGARAFHDGHHAAAERAFEALLALAPEDRQQRSTWAAYMLGRLRAGQSAARAYAEVRALVADGFADELGLAASSLGQEARIHLRAGDVVTAVRLYALQAAHGHPDGPTSLLFVIRDLIADAEESALLGDPVGQRLLAAYLYTRADDLTEDEHERALQALADAELAAGTDRLAAAAYRQGRWQLAETLAARDSQAPLSRWVRAKLALRAGDTAGAERLLALVADDLNTRADACTVTADATVSSRARLSGERAAVALAEGRVEAAMEQAWQARLRYPDAALIAERILTIDELQDFVATLARRPARPGDEPDVGSDTNADDSPIANGRWRRYWADYWGQVDEQTIRTILARRLMRAGRHDAAWVHFPQPEQGPARSFAQAMNLARSETDQIARARALFAAAQIARRHGLEILGTAHAPDWGLYGAQYDLSEWMPATDSSAFLSAVEIVRRLASAPGFNRRYHYRHLASALAEQAADALPRRSQAFAATLCHSARYVFHTDTERMRTLWHRYIDEGPYVPAVSSFGQRCPEPDFERARRYLAPERPSRRPLWLSLWALALVAVVFGSWRRARRQARPSEPAGYTVP